MTLRLTRIAVVGLSLALTAGCATTGAREPAGVHAMPSDLSRALPPGEAQPTNAAQLAEGALNLLDPDRPGGPDYEGAARMCLFAEEVADAVYEKDLRRACQRTAARSALRSGNRELYLDAVDRWNTAAPRNERATGELAVHLAISARLRQEPSGVRIPPEARRVIPALETRR